jgi:NAD(P)-dependent dehydrogenase (short-subunit alcohol dehydrogenase family)
LGLARLRGRLSSERRQVLVVDRSQRGLADRPDVEALAGLRSTPDHMLRIGSTTAVLHDEAVDRVEPSASVVLVPGLGCVAAAPNRRTARVRAEIAAHTHAAVAATLDAFGGASWLDEDEVGDFQNWPLELYKLTLAPPAPELAGQIAIVTGAASGIGREVARDLAARGAHLVLADLDADELAETARPLGEAVSVTGDLTDPATVDALVDASLAAYGGVDAVVFNAGIAPAGELAGLDAGEWQRTLDVNLTAQFRLTQRVWPVLREQGLGGSLVYMASKNAFAPGAGFGPYSVAKAGLVQLAKMAALEGGALGIRANVVNPDAIFAGSRLWSDELRRERAEVHGVSVDELEAFYAKRSLLGRPVTAADVAEAVAFLVSDRSRATTGCTITVDGGVPAAFPR